MAALDNRPGPLPLRGKRVLVTRPRHQAGDLADLLAQLGAQPVLLPAIDIAPLDEPAELDQALTRLAGFEWVVFTSANGVRAVWDRLPSLGLDSAAFAAPKVAAIGPATAQALSERAVQPDFVPAEYIAEAIAAGLGEVQGQRILLLRADIARPALADILRERGALVKNIPVYRTVLAQPDPQARIELERGVDVITFTSASTVRGFLQLAGELGGERGWPWLAQARFACIGPITADELRANGLPVHIQAGEYTAAGLARAIQAYFEREKEESR